ncbi:EF-hand domain-containing protein [Sphingomonas metalli]|uniref:EF-hand domain-containing protein n=1 Tax=Sphingomonas metalli TaxID=1779358 RepID=UPI00166D04A4|nr:EF-hand domain-containing protein [Sphingomonas metalli]
MWRYLAGGGAGLAAIGAGVVLWSMREAPSAALPPQPAATAGGEAEAALPDEVPEATAQTREARRFGRYDKDRDGTVTREEYLAARRKAFAKLDTNGDGRLSFDEWAVKAEAKFAAADSDHSGGMSPDEFATTAVKRKPSSRHGCPPERREDGGA